MVEGLIEGLIEVEEHHEGSVVEVEGLLLLPKLCRKGVCVLAVCMFCYIIGMGGFLVSLPGTVAENRQADIRVLMSVWVGASGSLSALTSESERPEP